MDYSTYIKRAALIYTTLTLPFLYVHEQQRYRVLKFVTLWPGRLLLYSRVGRFLMKKIVFIFIFERYPWNVFIFYVQVPKTGEKIVRSLLSCRKVMIFRGKFKKRTQ
jgi:hypothetical protein